MEHKLFNEIDKFEAWSKVVLSEPSRISAEWETDYPDWSAIEEHFEDLVRSTMPSRWSDHDMDRLSYIIARDIEDGRLMRVLPDDPLVCLAEYALSKGERNTRWQMALELPRLVDKTRAAALIERYTNDPDGEVKQIALHALAAVKKGEVLSYKDISGGA